MGKIKFLLHIKDKKKFVTNNKSIALNILFLSHNSQEIRHTYKTKHNLNRENQIIVSMINDGKKCNKLYNKLPQEIKRTTNLNSVKHNLKKHLLKELAKANF